jgi:hypothetical protein
VPAAVTSPSTTAAPRRSERHPRRSRARRASAESAPALRPVPDVPRTAIGSLIGAASRNTAAAATPRSHWVTAAAIQISGDELYRNPASAA